MIRFILTIIGTVVVLIATVFGLLLLPLVVGLFIGAAINRVATYLDDRYYDGIDGVKQAKSDGVWYYYLIHHLFNARELVVDALVWYDDHVLSPIFSRVPVTVKQYR